MIICGEGFAVPNIINVPSNFRELGDLYLSGYSLNLIDLNLFKTLIGYFGGLKIRNSLPADYKAAGAEAVRMILNRLPGSRILGIAVPPRNYR
ncbi:hypothetical protein GQR60_00810 [Labilibaculum sp. A4]|uniref:hypothetical protein n=1 Tax=Labilibaculum euxinus TaxID=2686357 RepID=UPI000F617B40|nr:hypothetical protein [Labilibaculum euxinus]MDQ1769355.1 hypothetical protein [Labilibaculum euxinus]MWN74881.1 hypothetical protein [Labilibaculum euxinus]